MCWKACLLKSTYSVHSYEWLLFAALGMLAGSLTIRVASVEASISVADTFFIAAAMLFGPAPATAAIALDSLVLSARKKHGAVRIGFNVAASSLSLWIAAHAFFAIARTGPLASTGVAMAPVGALIALTIIYFVLNSSLIAVAVALESSQNPFVVWREHFLWLGIGYLAAASMAFCVAFITQQIGIWSIAVVAPVLVTFHLTLRASFGRVDDARRHVVEVDRLYTSTIETLAMAIDAKDDVTHNHVRRVQAYAKALAAALGIKDELTLKAIDAAALLHDTGKLAVPERILNKPGGLTPGEFEQMKRHVEIGADILTLVDFPFPVVPIVRCHHENWDGSGYPAGVAGDTIPIGARILSVVDCFDALTSDRPYRKKLPDAEAVAILLERRGRMYDPLVVDTFIRVYKDVQVSTQTDAGVRDVMARISAGKHSSAPTLEVVDPRQTGVPVGSDVLAFVSLARVASGIVSPTDVLALATHLVQPLVPGSSGAWFVRESEHLVAVNAFGAAAPALRGFRVALGDRVSGWAAANGQVIVNADAALELGPLTTHTDPPLAYALSVPFPEGLSSGTLTLFSPDRYSDDHGRLLQMIVPHVAQALACAASASRLAQQPEPGRALKLVQR